MRKYDFEYKCNCGKKPRPVPKTPVKPPKRTKK